MRARSSYGLRLCVDEIYLDRILFYLEQIEYPGDLEFARKIFIALQRRTDAYTLHIDLSPQVGVRIGLECYLDPRLSDAHQQMRREQLLAFLVESGMCAKSKVSGLAHFSGIADARQIHTMASESEENGRFSWQVEHVSKATASHQDHMRESKSPQAKHTLRSTITGSRGVRFL